VSGPQIIFLVLVAVVTVGSFLEASAHENYRVTAARVALALLSPLAWCLLIVLPPWGFLFARVFSPWFLLLLPVIPVFFVGTLAVWIGWSMTLKSKSAGKVE
jgi:hypothetical protein